MTNVKKIKTLDGFSNTPEADLVDRATAVYTHITGNPHFPNPPVDLEALKKAIDAVSALRVEALDGSKKVIAEKKKQRGVMTEILRLLARYVEFTSKGDMTIFQTSGFEAASRAKTSAQPLSEKIRKIEHGSNSGQVRVWLTALAKAFSYEIRHAPAVNGGMPATFTREAVTRAKTPVILDGLTPGTTYVFQARALTNDGYTDWSNPVQFICT